MTAGGWMGIDPDDTPLLVRDAGTQDIHALTRDLPQLRNQSAVAFNASASTAELATCATSVPARCPTAMMSARSR